MFEFIGYQSLFSIVIAILITWYIARYFYKLSTKKELSFFLLMHNKVFSGLKEEDLKLMKVTYAGNEVINLHQTEFIIANTGERPIENITEPLSLIVPKGIKIIDISVTFKKPDNLIVNESKEIDPSDNHKALFNFKLMNKNEFFLCKILSDGDVNHEDISFQIEASDLERNYNLKAFDKDDIHTSDRTFYEKYGLILGLSLMLLMAFSYGTYDRYEIRIFWENFFPGNASGYIYKSLNLILVVFHFFIGFIGYALTMEAKPKPKFIVPQDILSTIFFSRK